MKIAEVSNRAKQITRDLGAEAVVIIVVTKDPASDGWLSEHGAYMDSQDGLSWLHVAEAVAGASRDIITEPIIEDDLPS